MSNAAAVFEAFAPPGLVALGAVAVVLIEAMTHQPGADETSGRGSLLRRSALGLATGGIISIAFVIAGFHLVLGSERVATANGMVVVGADAHFAMAFLCGAALLVLWFATAGPKGSGVRRSEFDALLLFSLAGCLALVCAGNFVTLIVSIELASLCAIGLLALERRREKSLEAGTRLWLVLGFAGAITLYGAAILYGVDPALSFEGAVADEPATGPSTALLAVGLVLVMTGLLTRLGIAPFHHWLPNVSDGSTPVAAAWGTCVLVGAVSFATLHVAQSTSVMEIDGVRQVLRGFAMLSVVVGSGLALVQSSVKRLLAYGGVVHSGLFLGVLSLGNEVTHTASAAALFEVATFVVMQLGAFGVISVLTREQSGGVQLGEFAGLAERAPILAAAFAILLLGLAGLPGTVGFISRFQLMQVMIESENIVLALVVAFGSVVLFAAYLRVAIAMYMLRGAASMMPATPLPAIVALLVCASFTLVFGIAPAGEMIRFDLLELTRLAAAP